MNVTVEVVGEGARDLSVAGDATYADLIREVGYSPQEASALVDGSPVPENRAVDADRVKVLRLIKGGSGEGGSAGESTPEARERADVAEDPDPYDLDFEAPNAGPGPDPIRLSEIDADLVVLLFHRDFLCGNCRKQVESVCERYDEFAAAGAEVVSVLPEPRDKADAWVDYHDMPYPIVADPDNEVADQYDQPVRLGPLGRKFDLLGRMPEIALVDVRRDPELLWSHVGSTPVDRPDVDTILGEVEKFA